MVSAAPPRKSCPCYWGCGTTTNKACYGAMACFLVTGVVFIAAAIGGVGVPCGEDFNDCRDDCARSGGFFSYYEYSWGENDYGCKGTKQCCDDCWDDFETCGVTYIALLIVGIVILSAASCPCYFFCCCARPPATSQAMIEMGAQPGYAIGQPAAVPLAAAPAPPMATAPAAPAQYPPQGMEPKL